MMCLGSTSEKAAMVMATARMPICRARFCMNPSFFRGRLPPGSMMGNLAGNTQLQLIQKWLFANR